MAITNWFRNKREQVQQDRQISQGAKAAAQKEAEQLRQQQEADRQKELYRQQYQRELDRRTTPKTQRLKQGMEKANQTFNKLGMESKQFGSNLGQSAMQGSDRFQTKGVKQGLYGNDQIPKLDEKFLYNTKANNQFNKR